jgi:hypothetical protein
LSICLCIHILLSLFLSSLLIFFSLLAHNFLLPSFLPPSLSPTQVAAFFDNFEEADYARAGSLAPRAHKITASQLAAQPISMAEQLKKLSLPVEIKNGIVTFVGVKEYGFKKGQELSSEHCKILGHFGVQMSIFKVKMIARWSKGEFEEL